MINQICSDRIVVAVSDLLKHNVHRPAIVIIAAALPECESDFIAVFHSTRFEVSEKVLDNQVVSEKLESLVTRESDEAGSSEFVIVSESCHFAVL
jgi:hypothetical protein